MTTVYASGRETLSQSDWAITTTNDGQLTSKAVYFTLQTQNNAGLNKPLFSTLKTINANDKVTITIEDTIRKEGEGWLYVVIGCSLTEDADDANQIAKIPLFNLDTFGYPIIDEPVTYPITIEFEYDHQLTTGELVATVDDLPSTNLINGVRYAVVEKDNNIYELNLYSVLDVDDDLVLDAAIGRWLLKSSFSNNVIDVALAGGANVDLLYLTDSTTLEIPSYDPDGNNSPKLQYWIVNDLGVDIEAGKAITLNVDAGGYDKTQLFDNKIVYVFHGFANTTTGTLRTTYDVSGDDLTNINLENFYSANYPTIGIEDTLKAGEALLITLFVRFDLLEVQGKLPNTTLSIYPEIVSTSGTFNPLGTLFEKGFISKELDRLRVYPDEGLAVKVKSGSGIVRNFSFWKPFSQSVVGLTPNATNELYVDKDGVVYLDTVENSDSVLRALVKTENIESKASTWSTYAAVTANGRLQITVTYPCNSNLVATIRSTYPDVIANTSAYFNPRKINVYVQRESDGQIRKFSNIVATPIANQTVVISNWSNGTVVTSVPSVANGLFDPATATIVGLTNAGNMTATNYRVSYTLVWDGTVVSDIDHSTSSGCITEIQLAGEDVFGMTSFNTLDEVRAITVLYDGRLVYCKETENAYIYNSTNTQTDDDYDYLEPTDAGGRWINIRRGIGENLSLTSPNVLDFAPRTVNEGDTITIYGSNFTTATSGKINTTNLDSFTVINDTTITGVVAAGTTTGKITITNPSGEDVSLVDVLIGNALGGVLYVTDVKTTAFETEPFKRYPLDSTSASFTVTLHSPEDGDTVGFYDASTDGCFTEHPVILSGDKTIYTFDDWILNRDFENIELIYKASVDKWAISNSQTPAFGGGGSGGGDLVSLQSRMTTAEGKITGLETLTGPEGHSGALDDLDGRVDDLETTIGALGNLGAGLTLLEDIYIAPDNPDAIRAWTPDHDPITNLQFKAANGAFQTSDPEADGFRAFKSLSEAAKYCNENISDQGVVTLYLKPGRYFLDADFNCSVVINGVENGGIIGDYKATVATDLPTNSVIFYQSIEVETAIDSDGDKKIHRLRINGTLSIRGSGVSTISNCHFWGSVDWLRNEDKSIEDLIVETLADVTVVDSWLGTSMEIPLLGTSKIYVENGQLNINGIVTMGSNFPSSYEFGASRVSTFYVNNGILNIDCLRLRGNGLWIVPVSASIAEPGNTRTVLIFDDTWEGWAKCDVTGALTDSGDYRCASGFDQRLFYFTGNCQLGLGRKRNYISVVGVGIYESALDINCIRLERNWDELYGTTDTNDIVTPSVSVTPDINWQGSDNLGVHGASVFYSDTKSPSFRVIITLPEADSYLKLLNFIWNDINSVSNPGFNGVFGSYCDVAIDEFGVTSFTYYETASITFVDKGFGITLNEGGFAQRHRTLWVKRATSGVAPDDYATILSTLKIRATEFSQNFYLNNVTCTDTGLHSGQSFSKFSIPSTFTW